MSPLYHSLPGAAVVRSEKLAAGAPASKVQRPQPGRLRPAGRRGGRPAEPGGMPVLGRFRQKEGAQMAREVPSVGIPRNIWRLRGAGHLRGKGGRTAWG
eukprot:scaffold33618_cov101-Isochrysis_galbana.AAC.3